MLFAFYGRVSTEDQQDPASSRAWQLSRARALIEPHGGEVVTEFFDIGQSRSYPWQRRPRADALLKALPQKDRGFDGVVIGEPQRAFYGNQFGLTFPLFVHYGVQLWVPEVGGPLDPENEAHDLVMSVFGGMSKGERNRIKVRVRTAMATQTKIEGRFLGGRPPYGYLLADAGAHPNPGKAAIGARLHRLDLDPIAAPVVERIFARYLAGHGIYAIAEELTRDGIACPSAHDPGRNRHRSGVAWSKMAVRAILINPRYTGRQVWNRQRKDEVLLDVNDVALGHTSKLVWNPAEKWIWSDRPAHPAIIDTDTFEQAQARIATRGKATTHVKPRATPRPYLFRGLLYCGLCERRMQGQWLREQHYYRCRFPDQYAQANTLTHPRNIYLRESQLVTPLDDWLLTALAPPQLEATIDALDVVEDEPGPDPSQLIIKECDRKLANYRALVDAGTDPTIVTEWIKDTTAKRIAAEAATRKASPRLSRDEIRQMVANVGALRTAIRRADVAAEKAKIYELLRLRLTYRPQTNSVRAEAELGPDAVGIGFVSKDQHEPLPHRYRCWPPTWRSLAREPARDGTTRQ